MSAVTVACFDFIPCIFATYCCQRSGSGLGCGVKDVPSDGFTRKMAMFVAGSVGAF